MRSEPIQQIDRTWCVWRGQTLAYFAGCDYFRLASHPAVLAAAREALDKYGLNVAASRYTTGNHILYEQLESALGEFLQAESALLIANGYLTNLAVVQGLACEFTHILIDERAHSSLFDAAIFTGQPVIKFAHCDIWDFARRLKELPKGSSPLCMTDSVFAHNGENAPVTEYLSILRAAGFARSPQDRGWLLIDDSHGSVEFCKLLVPQMIQTLTLSKSFGSYGGVICSTRAVRAKIESKSRAIAGATPLPLPCAAAALKSIQLLKDNSFRERLSENVNRIALGHMNPIFSVVPNDETDRDLLGRALLERGIFPSYIRYQDEGYFRFAVSSEHTRAQVEALVAAIPSQRSERLETLYRELRG